MNAWAVLVRHPALAFTAAPDEPAVIVIGPAIARHDTKGVLDTSPKETL